MSIKITYDKVRAALLKENYILLTKEYINSKSELVTVCPFGHIFKTKWEYWNTKRKHRCSKCAGNAKYTIEEVRLIFNEAGYNVIDTNYINSKNKINYICNNGHRHSIRIDHFNDGIRCPYCSGKVKKTLDDIKKALSLENYQLLSDDYRNTFEDLKIQCDAGHVYCSSYHNWMQGKRCPYCNGGISFGGSVVKLDIEGYGYRLVGEYLNSNSLLHLMCPNNHDYFVRYNNWKHKNSRCTECSGSGVSNVELLLREFLFNKNIIFNKNDKNRIKPYELDIVIPEKKIAIEYCGLYWHSELNGKDKNYHLNKLNMCLEKGYRLITIFEDEWVYRKDILLSRLQNLLNSTLLNKVYARKCTINEISANQAKFFCEQNHLQGYGSGSSIKLGAFYNEELVSVMTFSKSSIAKGSKNKEGTWELHRFCSKLNTRVIGIASKLLKYFERSYEWKELFSYADRRWSDGSLYEKIGFSLVGNTKPNYWYIKNKKRTHRFALRKNKKDIKELTEWENRQLQGWDRIWDCGNLKYIKHNNLL